MKQIENNGSVIVEFTIILVFAMIIIFIAVVEDGGVIDDLEQHEDRYIDAISAP